MNRREVNKDISKFLLLSYTEEKKKTKQAWNNTRISKYLYFHLWMNFLFKRKWKSSGKQLKKTFQQLEQNAAFLLTIIKSRK